MLIELWEKLADLLGLMFDPILVQSTSERLMLTLLRGSSITALPAAENSPVRERKLTESEECSIMYCGGYVVRKLEKRMCLEQSRSSAKYVATLQAMCTEECEAGDNEEFGDFVRRWMNEVSRGGLKILKEAAFECFKQIELCVYNEIQKTKVNDPLNIPGLIQRVLDDVDIQFLWCMLVVDLDEEEANTLLTSIVQMWISLRGHSHASAIVEKYKCAVSAQTKKSKGVRKALKFGNKS